MHYSALLHFKNLPFKEKGKLYMKYVITYEHTYIHAYSKPLKRMGIRSYFDIEF